MSDTSVSTIIANYNSEAWIEAALDSLLSQSLPPTEVIIVDDASTDNSLRIIESYARRYPSIRLLRNERNMGCAYSSDVALRNARGAFIAGLGTDDLMLPGFLEKSVQMLLRYPSAALCCSDPASFVDGSEAISQNHLGWANQPVFLSPLEFADVLKGSYVPGHSSIFRREAFLQSGGYLPELRWHSDWFANLVMSFRHGICYLPGSLAALRIRPTSFSARENRKAEEQQAVLRALLSILLSPGYADVLPHFMLSGALSHFGNDLVKVVMSAPEFQTSAVLLLIQRNLHAWARQADSIADARLKQASELEMQGRLTSAFRKASEELNKGSVDTALSILQQLAQQYPHQACTHQAVARVADSQNQLTLARHHLFLAIRLAPHDPDLYKDLARVCLKLGDAQLARTYFETVLTLDPGREDVRAELDAISQHGK